MCSISYIQYAQINKPIEPTRAIVCKHSESENKFLRFLFSFVLDFVVEMRKHARERTHKCIAMAMRKIHFQQLQIVQQQQSINLSKWWSTAFYLHNTRCIRNPILQSHSPSLFVFFPGLNLQSRMVKRKVLESAQNGISWSEFLLRNGIFGTSRVWMTPFWVLLRKCIL